MTELNQKMATAWESFVQGEWQTSVNVRDFIQKTTHRMKATKRSWPVPLRQQLPCGTK
ncbi:hypothetical protein ERHA55_16250 [Erwinia rhapontici]|nr:hypothetical protein ERHA55_16250 [Erwinia rhapontici]